MGKGGGGWGWREGGREGAKPRASAKLTYHTPSASLHPNSQIELSYLSLVAVNTDKGSIIGFASFDDHALLQSKSLAASDYFHNWFHTFNTKTSGCNAQNTLWLTYFCAADKNETEVVNQMVRTTYLTLPDISNVAFRLPRETRGGVSTVKLKFLMSSTVS